MIFLDNALPYYLIKSCKKEFNTRLCNTLQIGTLDFYRKSGDPTIADIHEGYYNIDFDLRGIHAEKDLHLKLMNLSNYDKKIFVDSIQGISPSFISKNHSFYRTLMGKINFTHHNKFILCFSGDINPGKPQNTFQNYDDVWHLERKDIKKGIRFITNDLFEHVKKELNNGKKIFLEPFNAKHLNVQSTLNKIIYKPRIIKLKNIDYYKDPDFIYRMQYDIPITKPLSYSPEREYRVSFTFSADGYTLTPAIDSLIIPTDSFSKFLRSI